MSCSDDAELIVETCEEHADLGLISLLDESKSFLPYTSSDQQLVFTDSMGQEYTGAISQNDILIRERTYPSFLNGENGYTCPADPSILIDYIFEQEIQEIDIDLLSLGLSIELRVYPLLNMMVPAQKLIYDRCTVRVLDLDTNTRIIDNMSFVVDERNFNVPPLISV